MFSEGKERVHGLSNNHLYIRHCDTGEFIEITLTFLVFHLFGVPNQLAGTKTSRYVVVPKYSTLLLYYTDCLIGTFKTDKKKTVSIFSKFKWFLCLVALISK